MIYDRDRAGIAFAERKEKVYNICVSEIRLVWRRETRLKIKIFNFKFVRTRTNLKCTKCVCAWR